MVGSRPTAGRFVGDAESPGAVPAAAQAGYPLVIWLLVVGNSAVRAAGFAHPFLAYHVAGRGHGAAAVGAVLAAFGVGWVVGQLVCGWLVDRIGGRATLVATLSVAVVALVLLAGAHSVAGLVAAAAVTGVVFDAATPVIGAAIAELVPEPAQRAKVDGWRYSWGNIGLAVSGAIGGFLADGIAIPVLYYVNAIACAAFAVVVACCVQAAPQRVATTGRTGYREALSDRRLVLLLLSSLATLTAFMGFYAAMPMVMGECGLGVGAFGWVRLANAVAVIALAPLITPMVSRQIEAGPRLDILGVAAVWMTVAMGAAALAHTTVGFMVAGAALAPGEIAWFVVGAGVVHRISPLEQRGRYYGIWAMALAAAAVLAPILASFSLASGGRPLVAATTLAIGLVGAVLCRPLARVLPSSVA